MDFYFFSHSYLLHFVKHKVSLIEARSNEFPVKASRSCSMSFCAYIQFLTTFLLQNAMRYFSVVQACNLLATAITFPYLIVEDYNFAYLIL